MLEIWLIRGANLIPPLNVIPWAKGMSIHFKTQHILTLYRLVDNIFEEYPPPQPILSLSLAANSPTSQKPEPHDPNTPPKQYRLSFLHRHFILGQIKILNLLGVCFGSLGSCITALQYQFAAHTLLSEICLIVSCFGCFLLTQI